MKNLVKLILFPVRLFALTYLSSVLVIGNPPVVDDDDEVIYEISPFEISGGGGYRATSSMSGSRMGATVGGAQDVNYARSEALRGNIPHPDSFTPEGLFSEHDLPLEVDAMKGQLLTVGGQAMRTSILGVPEAEVLAQIGFGSGLDATTWNPTPLNLVAVVDKSGSMSGQPLELVKQSLRKAVLQLGEQDQISIVLFGDDAEVVLREARLTKQNRSFVLRTISNIQSSGSTAMERGLEMGYDVADFTAKDFEGNTRIMLFTDERPNVGNTKPKGFMGLMRNGSKMGIGLTTIGVGVDFGAKLANKISAVRGGNLFYFPDYGTMADTFEKDFDTMVTELAYNMQVVITPEEGWEIEAVYGVPANMLEWGKDKSIRMNIETLFLSREKGALFFALSSIYGGYLPSSQAAIGARVASIKLQYLQAGQREITKQSIPFKIEDRSRVGKGLRRGEILVSQYTGLKKATSDYHLESDSRSAFGTLKSLSRLLRKTQDEDLIDERKFVDNLTESMAALAGYDRRWEEDEIVYPVTGIWNAFSDENRDIETDMILTFSGDKYIELAAYDDEGYIDEQRVAVGKKRFSKFQSGKIEILQKEAVYPFNYEAPFDIDDSDYLSNVKSIKYKIKGDHMEVKVYRDREPSPLTIILWRNENSMSQITASFLDDVQVDPISGLPVR